MKPKPRLFLIESKEQLLYLKERSKEYDALLEVNECHKLKRKRVFRTSNETFLISQLMVESGLEEEKAAKIWTTRFAPQYSKAGKQKLIEFPDEGVELPRQGRAPTLTCLDDLQWFKDLVKSGKIENVVADWVARLIDYRLSKLRDAYSGSSPSDLLILVPFAVQSRFPGSIEWASVARRALDKQQIRYIDYAGAEDVRRVQFSPSEVRLCTYHSARGIEALHVILLGFEQMSEASGKEGWRIPHLAYIATSRSVYDTDIVYCRLRHSREVQALEAILSLTGFADGPAGPPL